MSLDRAPTGEASLEHERALLGCALVDPRILDREQVSAVGTGDFYSSKLAHLWAAVLRCRSGDPRIVSDQVPEAVRSSLWRGQSLVPTLVELHDAVPTAANADYYAGWVKRHSCRRRLWAAAHHIAAFAKDAPLELSAQQLQSNAEAFLDGAGLTADQPLATKASELAPKVLHYLAEIRDGVQHGYPSGFRKLDEILAGGFRKAELTLIAGRPSMGKTSFLCNVMNNLVMRKIPCAAFSVEVSEVSLGTSMICAAAGVSLHAIRNRTATQEDQDQLEATAWAFGQLPMHVVDCPTLTIEAMASQSRRLVREHGVKVIAVDYAQRMQTARKLEGRVQQIEHIAVGLKQIARQLDVAVIALAQLKRPPTSMSGKKAKVPPPGLADLKGSGALEEVSDVTILLHRPEYYEHDPEAKAEVEGLALATVAKNRHGPTEAARLWFNKACVRFENPRPKWKPRSK